MAYRDEGRSESVTSDEAGDSWSGEAEPIRTPLALFDQTLSTTPHFSEPDLPAVLAGGLDYVYRARTPATVPSSDETHVVPLDAASWPVTTRYAAAPGLRPTAYLEATVKNARDTPLLAGPVDIFVGADYVGTGALETTGPGGEVTLPLGADEDIRLVRRVLPKTVTEGVFNKEQITRYVTEVDVANDKRRPVTVRVVEQYPIGGVSQKVDVEREAATPKPVEGPDETGRMVFEVEVPAGAKRTISFAYRIRRPENWKLYQQ